MPIPKPLVVVILDGWGVSFLQDGNAIAAAQTPVMDDFARFYPSASVLASGIEVGLPWGEVGNSETGHRNIGAGSIQYQTLPMIDQAVESGAFFEDKTLLGALAYASEAEKSLHLVGLVSPGGIHSHMNHLWALLKLCKERYFKRPVYIHMITDGRDTMPTSALTYLQRLEEEIKATGIGVVASVTGRLYAMDRNNNWERTEATYQMLIGGRRESGAPSARAAIEQAYAAGLTDETILPTAMTRGGGPIGAISPGDAVIFFNFRPDRARQLAAALTASEAAALTGTTLLADLYVVTMAKYGPESSAKPVFLEEAFATPLAKVLSDAGLRQFHVAETEKYAHVTYYLNVGREEPFEGEEREMMASDSVKNFADAPRMQAGVITDRVIEIVRSGGSDVLFVNYANADMVGHTGNFAAAVEACQFVDECLGRLREAVFESGGALLVTADHGNAEEMIHPNTGEVETDHTGNPVPFHYVRSELRRATSKSPKDLEQLFYSPVGILTDVAPTILDILHLEKPATMTGVSLLTSLN